MTLVAVPAAAGAFFVRVEVVGSDENNPATLAIGDNSLTADRITLEANGAFVEVSGENLDLLLAAGGTRILGIQDASFAFQFSADGVAGAAVNAVVSGPDFGDDFALSGTATVLVNTTNAEVTLQVGGETVVIEAATGGLYVRVDITDGILSVLGNELTADRFSFELAGTEVEVSGDNLGLLMTAGGRRVVQLSDADFFFRFINENTDDGDPDNDNTGIVGAVINATVLGPDFGDTLSINGVASLLINTTSAPVVDLPVGGELVDIPDPLGGSFVRIDIAPIRAIRSLLWKMGSERL